MEGTEILCMVKIAELQLVVITHCIFLGLKFLVRNEEKDEIPCQGMRKIQGIF